LTDFQRLLPSIARSNARFSAQVNGNTGALRIGAIRGAT